MKRSLCLLVALCLGIAVSLHAEDQSWNLTDGRTVTVIKVLSQNATHVTVRCADGTLLTACYSDASPLHHSYHLLTLRWSMDELRSLKRSE